MYLHINVYRCWWSVKGEQVSASLTFCSLCQGEYPRWKVGVRHTHHIVGPNWAQPHFEISKWGLVQFRQTQLGGVAHPLVFLWSPWSLITAALPQVWWRLWYVHNINSRDHNSVENVLLEIAFRMNVKFNVNTIRDSSYEH